MCACLPIFTSFYPPFTIYTLTTEKWLVSNVIIFFFYPKIGRFKMIIIIWLKMWIITMRDCYPQKKRRKNPQIHNAIIYAYSLSLILIALSSGIGIGRTLAIAIVANKGTTTESRKSDIRNNVHNNGRRHANLHAGMCMPSSAQAQYI